ncbi:hypothetical protein OUZ56_011525 [Daphnia magna]|uniref:Uncharacterized protein n=1 Tax=Daphnia magna TaxID=35525 RepID=A0ABQ9Z0F3_9CRUS|nr:hypothetical protein OUZ56_011525 [Daphnia magna]
MRQQAVLFVFFVVDSRNLSLAISCWPSIVKQLPHSPKEEHPSGQAKEEADPQRLSAGTISFPAYERPGACISDAQCNAFLKQLLTTEVRSYKAEYLDNPSTYYDALEELKMRYGKPQVVARSHLMALMNLPSIRDDD